MVGADPTRSDVTEGTEAEAEVEADEGPEKNAGKPATTTSETSAARKEPSPRERAGEERLPSFAGGRVVDAGVDEREARSVLDEVEVHVIEPEGQLEPRPEESGSHFDDLARRGRRRERKDQRPRRGGGGHDGPLR